MSRLKREIETKMSVKLYDGIVKILDKEKGIKHRSINKLLPYPIDDKIFFDVNHLVESVMEEVEENLDEYIREALENK